MKEKILGVLGGVGPLATVYFAKLLVEMTKADCDQNHISSIILNHSSIPDRTEYILDNTKPNPLPVMSEDAKMLERMGADFIVIPCNTAHYFYEQIQKQVNIPLVNIIEETVEYALKNVPSLKKLGILATKGTISARSYQRACESRDIVPVVPSIQDEQALMHIIYNQVKAGKKVDFELFMSIIDTMKNDGCNAIVLGCTELSVIKHDFNITRPDIIDSMEVLAKRSIELCGKELAVTI